MSSTPTLLFYIFFLISHQCSGRRQTEQDVTAVSGHGHNPALDLEKGPKKRCRPESITPGGSRSPSVKPDQ